MNIKSSKEIIKNILERYNFSQVYNETEKTYGLNVSKNVTDSFHAIDFLYASAVTGNKTAGIFEELPHFSITVPLRGECLLITSKLPKSINAPTIFIRKASELTDKLVLALKVSVEGKVPAVVVISPNAENNYAEDTHISSDIGRISPFISGGTFKQRFSKDELKNVFDNIETLLEAAYPEKTFSKDGISFYNHRLDFPDYMIPARLPKAMDKFKKTPISAPQDEIDELSTLFLNGYNREFSFNAIEANSQINTAELLCPGCPFVNIHIRAKEKSTVVFTDVNCPGVKTLFPDMTYISPDGYMGIINSEIKADTLFIGKASSYKAHYGKLSSGRGRMILLNDCALSKLDGFHALRHPKKLSKSRNTLYPYSCGNIKKYSKVRINFKKCECLKDNTECKAIGSVFCPAIYKADGKYMIDSDMCSGCLACKAACDRGAVS